LRRSGADRRSNHRRSLDALVTAAGYSEIEGFQLVTDVQATSSQMPRLQLTILIRVFGLTGCHFMA
jgi:hypothetical protein